MAHHWRAGRVPCAVLPGCNDAYHLVQQPVDLLQKGSMRRLMKDEPEYNRIATYQSINDAYVVKTMASARWSLA
ncbi:P2 family phage major capsid protein [Escherichia coli]|uniref:P2 family phage major capsid protein n=1 Tax=Escherichia coli TaxID=562 RepID=UPI003F53CCA4